MSQNHYATAEDIRQALGETDTDLDARYFRVIGAASRSIDQECRREFFVTTAVKRFNTPPVQLPLYIPDLLDETAIEVDINLDGTFSTTVPESDYELFPLNDLPFTHVTRKPLAAGLFLAQEAQANVRITGDWGYGNGRDASPVFASGVTVTIADASETEVDVDAEGTIEAGHTILVGTERLFVSAATSDDTKKLTVIRGVNGSTAAAATELASIYQYPDIVREVALRATLRQINIDQGDTGTLSERIGQYSRSLLGDATAKQYRNGLHQDERTMLDGLRRKSTL